VHESVAGEIEAAVGLVRSQLRAEQEARKLPGLSAAVVHGQATLWSGGFGQADLGSGRPAGADTVYRMASITKLFTAAALMLLRDAGRLQLDDPIERHLSEARLRSRFADGAPPPTLRQAAAHVAGLPREAPLEYWETFKIPPIEALLASLADSEMALRPLTEVKYSNLGYALLGHVVERVSGQAYERFVAERMLRPLEMVSSGFDRDLPDGVRGRIAVGYWTPPEKEREPAPHLEEGGMNAAGGLYSTVDDIARFVALQFRDGPVGGAQVLAGGTLREMRAPVFLASDWKSARGIGWQIERVAAPGGHPTAVGHSGGLPGWATNVMLVPELEVGVAVFVNTGADAAGLSRAALEVLVPVLARLKSRSEAAAAEPLPEGWQRYAGRYRSGLLEVEVKPLRGRLAIVYPEAPPGSEMLLSRVGDDVFRSHDGEIVAFDRDDAGQAIRLRGGAAVFRRVPQETSG
jgi:CubicO group peptidase (beta-lactamase class C family)